MHIIENLNLKVMGAFSIETQKGKLEVSKGVYLTMLKSKNSAKKTLTKHKPISYCY